MMIKVLLVSLVVLGNFLHSTTSFPAPLKDSRETNPKSRRDVTNTIDDSTTTDEVERVPEKRGFKFGTALGHNTNANEDSFANDWWKAYNSLYKDSSKRGLSFGSALDHPTKNKNEDNFYKEYLKKFKEYYFPEAEKRGLTFGTALGHSTGGSDQDFNKAYLAKFNEFYGKRDTVEYGEEE